MGCRALVIVAILVACLIYLATALLFLQGKPMVWRVAAAGPALLFLALLLVGSRFFREFKKRHFADPVVGLRAELKKRGVDGSSLQLLWRLPDGPVFSMAPGGGRVYGTRAQLLAAARYPELFADMAEPSLPPPISPGTPGWPEEAALKAQAAALKVDAASLAGLIEIDGRKLYRLIAPGERALETWERLRAGIERFRRWPVILGPDHHLGWFFSRHQDPSLARSDDIFAEAQRLDLDRWVSERLAPAGGILAADQGPELVAGAAPPAEPSPAMKLTAHADPLTGQPWPRVYIALLPLNVGWPAMAILKLQLGGAGASPPPAVHCALMKRWAERHGAELVAAGGDAIELSVARPPRTLDAARALAREQLAYCPDIVVSPDPGSIDAMAKRLVGARVWRFWWD